jgi:hypothetical protein
MNFDEGDLKNIDSFRFYERFTKTQKIAKIKNWGYKRVDISRTARLGQIASAESFKEICM